MSTQEEPHVVLSIWAAGVGRAGAELTCPWLEKDRKKTWKQKARETGQSWGERRKRKGRKPCHQGSQWGAHGENRLSTRLQAGLLSLLVKKLKVKYAQPCPTLLQPHGLYSPRNSPGHNTGVGSLSLLQGIFPTQGSNPGLPHCRLMLLPSWGPVGEQAKGQDLSAAGDTMQVERRSSGRLTSRSPRGLGGSKTLHLSWLGVEFTKGKGKVRLGRWKVLVWRILITWMWLPQRVCE